MSNTQEQSLNEDVVFSPVDETCVEFLHCERERCALECLLREGPGAFHSKLKLEQLGAFISPEEAAQISGWVQDYRCSQVLAEEDPGEPSRAHISSCYWPALTDAPLPKLQLGWPEKHSWPDGGPPLVYTNPPLPGSPPIREVLRRMIQGAQTLVAVVTDRLTDSAVIGDLQAAASRGVPVYVILNKRSAQDGFTSPRLIHQNIRVRVLGGKAFCSRDGKMVVGDLKENFLLVDLETVVVGSYSLTWTDTHLHRQLVTVLKGPVLDCFDKEFRILYAASTPIPESCWGVNNSLLKLDNAFLQSNHVPKTFPLDIVNEEDLRPPPTNDPIDWDALGVKDQFSDDPFNLAGEMVAMTLTPPPLYERWTTVQQESFARRVEFQRCVPPAYEEQSRTLRLTETCHFPSIEKMHWNPAGPEGILHGPQSWQKIYETESREQIFQSNIHKIGPYPAHETLPSPYSQQIHEENGHSPFNLMTDSDRGLWSRTREIGPGHGFEKNRFAKKPLILMVPVPDGSGSVRDILKGFNTESTATENLLRSSLMQGKGISESVDDLSSETDQVDKTAPDWRTHDSGSPKLRLTPAQTLMKTRNDELKTASSRLTKMYTSPFRPRASNYELPRDWERPAGLGPTAAAGIETSYTVIQRLGLGGGERNYDF